MIKNRRDAAMLAGLDDRMLADIGLTRGDLRDAYSEPVWRDPTAILVSRAHERRINRRRVGIGLRREDVRRAVDRARRRERRASVLRRRRDTTELSLAWPISPVGHPRSGPSRPL